MSVAWRSPVLKKVDRCCCQAHERAMIIRQGHCRCYQQSAPTVFLTRTVSMNVRSLDDTPTRAKNPICEETGDRRILLRQGQLLLRRVADQLDIAPAVGLASSRSIGRGYVHGAFPIPRRSCQFLVLQRRAHLHIDPDRGDPYAPMAGIAISPRIGPMIEHLDLHLVARDLTCLPGRTRPGPGTVRITPAIITA